jgi:hypothetical protein
MAESKSPNTRRDGIFQQLLSSLDAAPKQITDAMIRQTTDEDQKNVINACGDALREQVQGLTSHLRDGWSRLGPQGQAEVSRVIGMSGQHRFVCRTRFAGEKHEFPNGEDRHFRFHQGVEETHHSPVLAHFPHHSQVADHPSGPDRRNSRSAALGRKSRAREHTLTPAPGLLARADPDGSTQPRVCRAGTTGQQRTQRRARLKLCANQGTPFLARAAHPCVLCKGGHLRFFGASAEGNWGSHAALTRTRIVCRGEDLLPNKRVHPSPRPLLVAAKHRGLISRPGKEFRGVSKIHRSFAAHKMTKWDYAGDSWNTTLAGGGEVAAVTFRTASYSVLR